MTPDGDLAMEFARHGYSVDTHTLWFDTRRQHDAEPTGGGGEPGARALRVARVVAICLLPLVHSPAQVTNYQAQIDTQ